MAVRVTSIAWTTTPAISMKMAGVFCAVKRARGAQLRRLGCSTSGRWLTPQGRQRPNARAQAQPLAPQILPSLSQAPSFARFAPTSLDSLRCVLHFVSAKLATLSASPLRSQRAARRAAGLFPTHKPPVALLPLLPPLQPPFPPLLSPLSLRLGSYLAKPRFVGSKAAPWGLQWLRRGNRSLRLYPR